MFKCLAHSRWPFNILFLWMSCQGQNMFPSVGNWFLEEMCLPAVMKLINAEFHSDSDVCYYRADRAVAKKYPESVFKNFLLKNAEGEKMYIKTQSQHRIENLSKNCLRTCQFYLNISNYFYILLYIFNFWSPSNVLQTLKH